MVVVKLFKMWRSFFLSLPSFFESRAKKSGTISSFTFWSFFEYIVGVRHIDKINPHSELKIRDRLQAVTMDVDVKQMASSLAYI